MANTYATWNPDDKSSSVTLSNGDRTATGTNTLYKNVRATVGVSSGKWYFEIDNGVYDGSFFAGFANSTYPVTDSIYLGQDTNGWSCRLVLERFTYNASYTSYTPASVGGDLIGIALDMDSGKAWFSINGTWLTKSGSSQGDPANGLYEHFDSITGTIFPCSTPSRFSSCTIACDPADQTYSPPSGFTSGPYEAPATVDMTATPIEFSLSSEATTNIGLNLTSTPSAFTSSSNIDSILQAVILDLNSYPTNFTLSSDVDIQIGLSPVQSNFTSLSTAGADLQYKINLLSSPSNFVSEVTVVDVLSFRVTNPITRFFLKMTSNDTSTDFEPPISSFQATFREYSQLSYMSAVIPGLDYADQISDKAEESGAALILYMAYYQNYVLKYRKPIMRVALDTVTIDKGASSQSISLSGRLRIYNAGKTVTLTNSNYRNLADGKLRYRFPYIDMNVKPNDRCEIGEDSFVVDYITYIVSVGQQQMELSER